MREKVDGWSDVVLRFWIYIQPTFFNMNIKIFHIILIIIPKGGVLRFLWGLHSCLGWNSKKNCMKSQSNWIQIKRKPYTWNVCTKDKSTTATTVRALAIEVAESRR